MFLTHNNNHRSKHDCVNDLNSIGRNTETISHSNKSHFNNVTYNKEITVSNGFVIISEHNLSKGELLKSD